MDLPAPSHGSDRGSEAISTKAFILYGAMGFGATCAIILAGVVVWWLLRRKHMREARLQALADHDGLPEVERKLKKPGVPYLVVHPCGDAMVAFKDLEKQVEEEKGCGLDSIKAVHCSPPRLPTQPSRTATQAVGSPRGLGAGQSQDEAAAGAADVGPRV